MYFKGQTKDQAAAHLKELAKLHHPLKGGDRQTWQAINEEFNCLTFTPPQPEPAPEPATTPKRHEQKTDSSTPNDVFEAARKAKEIDSTFDVVINYRWCWVYGNTRPHWDALKAIGFYYSKPQDACYFRLKEDATRKRGKKLLSKEEKENKYGKQLF